MDEEKFVFGCEELKAFICLGYAKSALSIAVAMHEGKPKNEGHATKMMMDDVEELINMKRCHDKQHAEK